MSDSLWPHELQHAMLPFPSLSPGVCSNSCPLSRWCHPTISSSVIPFSSCPQPLPASGSFPMSWLFASGSFDTLHQIIEESASASALPMNIQGWFPLGLIGEGNGNPLWYSCLENPTDKGAFWATVHGVTKSRTWLRDVTHAHTCCPKSFIQHHSSKASILWGSAFIMVQLSHLYLTPGKTIALTIWSFIRKLMSLLFNMLFSFVMAFLPRSKQLYFCDCTHHLQWFWSPRK